ncbi:DUF1707 domain-containing protein [Actinosynnema sp. NPDC047251]|uniref:DUF1707 domain-containing protein n=1 Tax=Saccharothrix espanaensis (strain ATCC 51144 / DSM 44229 / JCM 9112 / NBRC 15066 / NRRL 15764) TaxID=1179773 RepID=K0K9Y6_SACES|nr:DUF1707 domain-containing protein [Saccharothrix espanaensis]CCH35131.1 hypothetical protein BN6_79130 [Saccharothrix espanaensis DSM 44229]
MTDFQRNDRALIARELAQARADGRLTEAEYEQRIHLVAAADSYAELAALTADLPQDAAPAPPARRSKRRMYALFLTVLSVNFLVWAIISLSLGEALHPWWVWLLFWGLLLLVLP